MFLPQFFFPILTKGDVYRSRRTLALVNDTNESPNPTEPITTTERIEITSNSTENETKNCTKAAILELPSDGLTRDERKHGWIILHILFALYCFWFLASICDDYFVPAIQSICSGNFSTFFHRSNISLTFLNDYDL